MSCFDAAVVFPFKCDHYFDVIYWGSVVELLFKIQTIQLPQDNQCLWAGKEVICGYNGARVSQSQHDYEGGKGCHPASRDLWSWKKWVANETSMHWENSGPKQATQNNPPPPLTHTHTHITPFIYKHYLYFVHTLAHAHTHKHIHSERL